MVAARVRDPHTVDDLVQEALTRVMASADRLGDEALAPYAVVTARNLVYSLARSEDRRRRNSHRLIDLTHLGQPEDEALRREERQAVEKALARLPAQDRDALVAHVVEGVDTASLAETLQSTPGAVAVRLARTRARVRVDYILALRRVEPPTEKCRPVLLSLSSGDRRRQEQLDAGAHLLECPTCAALSEPLLERRRSLAAFWPFALLATLARQLWRTAAGSPAQATAVVCAAAVVTVVAVLAGREPPPPARPPPTAAAQPAALVAETGPVLPLSGNPRLDRFAGHAVQGRGVVVQSVPADEGFWVGDSEHDRVWVQLIGEGESSVEIRQGVKVAFTGRMVPHGAGFAGQVGVDASEGAGQLDEQGHHIEVPVQSVQVG